VLGELVALVGNYIGSPQVIGPLGGGLFGWAASHYTARTNAKLARDVVKDRAEDAAQARSVRAETATIDSFVKREVAQAENLTERFKTLMDGYENRINDLTTEVHTLRQAVAKVQDTLDTHRQVCSGCPYRREQNGPA